MSTLGARDWTRGCKRQLVQEMSSAPRFAKSTRSALLLKIWGSTPRKRYHVFATRQSCPIGRVHPTAPHSTIMHGGRMLRTAAPMTNGKTSGGCTTDSAAFRERVTRRESGTTREITCATCNDIVQVIRWCDYISKQSDIKVHTEVVRGTALAIFEHYQRRLSQFTRRHIGCNAWAQLHTRTHCFLLQRQ